MKKDEMFSEIKGKLIVSCQADEWDPFDKPEYVTLFAKAAVMGGAAGIRSQGIEKTRMIVETVKVPVIGLLKSKFADGYVRITGSFKEVEDILSTGCHIIAVDGTFRLRENGINGPEFIKEIKNRYKIVVMADISVYEEGIKCAEAGADCISSTLSGYTPDTKHYSKEPDFSLVEKLVSGTNIPVIAEGKIHKPEDALRMINLGAWSVVVGTAITRPRIITSWFSEALGKKAE